MAELRYQLQLLASVHDERKQLPGVIRQRLKRMIDELAQNPRPDSSIPLQLSFEVPDWELRRLRVDQWRIVYAIDEEFKQVAILGIRKRPPYDYGDLEQLIEELE